MRKIPYILCIMLLATCAKEEITTRNYPRVLTMEVTNITSGSVTFHGKVYFTPGPIIDHGFVWSYVSRPDFTNGEIHSMGDRTGTGDFNATISWGLLANQPFYVRAYAKTETYTV